MRTKLVNGLPVAMTPAEEAARDAEEAAWLSAQVDLAAAQAKVASFDTAINTDTLIQQFKAMSAAEFDAWWDGNVTNAAQAIGVLKRLCKIIIRRIL